MVRCYASLNKLDRHLRVNLGAKISTLKLSALTGHHGHLLVLVVNLVGLNLLSAFSQGAIALS